MHILERVGTVEMIEATTDWIEGTSILERRADVLWLLFRI